MHVFVQPKGRCRGTFVEASTTGFDVVEQEDGTSAARFSFRVVAKRKGFEDRRLEYCKAGETDPYLCPEVRERLLREQEEERARMEKRRLRMEEVRARMEGQRAQQP